MIKYFHSLKISKYIHNINLFLAPTGAQEVKMLCLCPCVPDIIQIMSSSNILKSPWGY